jgi:glucose/arabinose dehydrogenase/endonuclease YncB( thermonuclease family)
MFPRRYRKKGPVRKKRWFTLLTALVAASIQLLGQPLGTGGAPAKGSGPFEIREGVRVIDGDTIEADLNGNRVGIGLVGIAVLPGNTECGQQALTFLESALEKGVRLEEDPNVEFDGRGRRMYYAVDPITRQSIALQLVKAGLARATGQGREKVPLRAEERLVRDLGRGCVGSPRDQVSSGTDSRPQAAIEEEKATSLRVAAAGPEPVSASPIAAVAALPSGFAESVVVNGLTGPTAFAFLPDGRILVSQKNGLLRLVKNGQLLATPAIDIRTRVNTYWDHGLLGLAVDPNFASNGYIYLLYTYENDAQKYTGTKTARLARYTMAGDTASIDSEFIVLGRVVGATCEAFPVGADCIPSDSPSHSVGNVKFASDGTMFVTVGDASHFNYVDERALRAQNKDSLAGKVLRITSTGSGLDTNPFYLETGDVNANRSKIWAYGLRNPFRFNLRPDTDIPYLGDVGWNTWEEINVANAGANMGWPCYEGDAIQGGYQFKPVCQTLYGQGPGATRLPLIVYAHSNGSGSATGGAFYTGTSYPAQYHGTYFYGDYSQTWIRNVRVDGANNLLDSPSAFASGTGNLVDIETGPDGNLYYIAIGAGQLRVIRHYESNAPPTAVASASPLSGAAPLQVQFTGSTSSDPDGDPLQYLWNFGNGEESSQANPTCTYLANGTYVAVLTVDDGRGGVRTASVTIGVGNTPPAPVISSPASSYQYQAGRAFTLSGSASDAQDGAIASSRLAWKVVIHHCPGGVCHTHEAMQLSGAKPAFTPPDHEDDSFLEFILTATDSQNASASTAVQIQPKKVPITLKTFPRNLNVIWNGASSVQSPLVVNAVVGGKRTITTDAAQAGYIFQGWSDNGAISHEITIGSSRAIYTAQFIEPGMEPPPPPTFHQSFDNNAGTGTMVHADAGDNCTLVGGIGWGEDPPSSSNFYVTDNAGAGRVDCGTGLDNMTDFSISAWFNALTYGDMGAGRIITKSASGGNIKWSLLLNDTDDTIRFVFQNSTGQRDVFDAPGDSMDDCVGVGWCHVGISISGCTAMNCAATFYINGAAVPTTQVANSGGTPKNDAAFAVEIIDQVSGGNTFDGFLDEIKVWAGKVLTPGMWTTVYSGGR